jgi:uncharacterized protein (DUF1778 family)
MHESNHDTMARPVTLRIPDSLKKELEVAARARGESLNRFATAVLRAAVDPAFAEDEASALRERLSRAGLLVVADRPARSRPSRKAFGRARAAAGRGRPLSKLVSEGRG